MSKPKEKFEALIFLDTNILLDFYRIRKSDISLKYLEEIKNHKDIIITTSQVEMEFKKNRQTVILDSIRQMKQTDQDQYGIPAILSDAKPVEIIGKSKKEITKQHKKLKQRIEKILKYPQQDPVFQSLQKLFSGKSANNLTKSHVERDKIRRLALKRFSLGYPPRKDGDNSIGDSVNWEWIIRCAEESGKHIVIVSRDADFGASHNSQSHLNDWLGQEFKERINRKRKVILTDKLSQAFKLVSIPVTKAMVDIEQEVIEGWHPLIVPKFELSSEFIKKLTDMQKTMSHLDNLREKLGNK